MRENVIRPAIRALLLALVLLPLLTLHAPQLAAAPADDTTNTAQVRAKPPVPRLFTKGDLLFLGATTASVAIAIANDQYLTDRAEEAQRNEFMQTTADVFQPLGRPQYLVAGALLVYGGGQMMKRPQVARRAARIAIAVTTAAATTMALKKIVGRERPEDSPRNSEAYKPFNGGESFPSGHATTAFAAAAALDRETDTRWVPYIAYPAATLVAWSRVHHHKHWTSDVIAGSAIGGWIAWKTHSFLTHRALGVPPGGKGDRTLKSRSGALLIGPRDGVPTIGWVQRFD